MSCRRWMIEGVAQAEQRCIRYHLIPVIERPSKGALAPDHCNQRGEDDGHPHQRRKASGEADAAIGCEREQYQQSHAEAREHAA